VYQFYGDAGDLWVPPTDFPLLDETVALSGGGGAAVSASSGGHKPRTPPPDLPSLLLNARIVYLGMPLVPAVTELIVAELLYLQYADGGKPMYVYINSTGTTRADGETIGFETEGTAILDTMRYVKNDVRFYCQLVLWSGLKICQHNQLTIGWP
jgi:Clp protease